MAEPSKRIHIGTSGWHYGHWSGPFYPREIPKKDFLKYYACNFHTVEINNSFYQLPSEKTLAAWRDTVLPGFIFTVKASRYITHMKKLKDSKRTLKPLLERVGTLGDKLGPILFQLPPKWRFNPDRLNDFLESLPSDHRYAMEFRDRSWEDPRTYEAMKVTGAAFCIYELDGYLSPKEITTDFVYVRLHGPEGSYKGQYSTQALAGWAGAFTSWESQGLEVFCYFDNDEAGYAAQDALKLKRMIYGKE